MKHPEPAELVEYWLSQADDDALEVHLLECSECTTALEWTARFVKAVREVVRRGNLGVTLTPEFLARLAAEGLRVRTYSPPSGGAVQCTVTPQDDFLMSRVQADLTSASRLDVLFCGEKGELRSRLEDVPFRPVAASEIVLNQPIDWVRSMGPDVLVMKLVAVENGTDRQLAEYTFHHTPTRQ